MWRGALTALAILITGCHGLELTGPGVISREAEALAGQRAAPRLERQFGGTYADPAIQDRLAEIGQRLALDPQPEPAQWRFALLASDEVNAFSLPGGLIYVTRGLCQRIGADNDLLAAAVAHEMSHVLTHDGLKPACGTPEESFDREAQADAGAVALLLAGGFEPAGLARLMEMTTDVQPAGWAHQRAGRVRQQTEK